MNKVHLVNVMTNHCITWETQKEVIKFSDIKENIQEFQPQANVKNISFMWKTPQTKKWLFITNNFIFKFKLEQAKKSSQELDDLWINYHIYNQPSLNSLAGIKSSVDECRSRLQEFKKRFDGEIIDINLFWANPLCTQESDKRNYHGPHNFIHQGSLLNHYPLKHSIQYRVYFNHLLKLIRESKKRIYLKIREFNQSSFVTKSNFSIVYLICHTEQKRKRKNSGDQGKPIANMEKKYSEEVSSKKKYEENTEKNYETYFVGETKDGQLLKIRPQYLEHLLEGKKIKLLILHTSYPYYHYPILAKKNIFQNVLLINSNPCYTDESTEVFLKNFMQKILNSKTIQNAYNETIKFVENQYSTSVNCCCYHDHQSDCNVLKEKRHPTRFQGFHYKAHVIRCQCFNAYKLRHSCKDKLNIVEVMYKKDENKSPMISFYSCCCQDEKNHEMYHSLRQKFQLTCFGDQSDNFFDFKEGQIKGDISCLENFQSEFKLIGNKSLYIKVLKKFVKSKQHEKVDKSEPLIFNLYGEKASGKSTLAKAICDIMLQKKIFTVLEKKKFRRFKDITFKEDENILYLLQYEPKKQKEKNFRVLNLEHLPGFRFFAILITTQKIKMELCQQHCSDKIQPFNKDDCENYIKAAEHLQQDMKEKVKDFGKFTWRNEWADKYYPLIFDIPEILSTVAESPYSDSSQYLCGLNGNELTDLDRIDFLLLMGVGIFIPVKKCQKLMSYFEEMQIYSQEVIMEEKKNEIWMITRGEILSYEKSKKFFYLFYQKYCYKTHIFQTLLKYYIRLTQVPKSNINLYDSTLDDKGSIINLLFGKKYKEAIKTKFQDEKLFKILQSQDYEFILQASLDLVRRILTSFYLFELHDNGENNKKKQLTVLCLFIINHVITYRKTSAFHEQQCEITSNQTQKTFGELQSPLRKMERRRKMRGSDDEMEGDIEKETNLVSSLVDLPFQKKEETPEISFLKNIEKKKSSENKRKGEKDLIIKKDYRSKSTLLYILNKLAQKKLEDDHLDIIIHEFILQLHFEEVYENGRKEENWKKIQAQIQILLSIYNRIKDNDQRQKSLKLRLMYDLWIAMILKATKCGRFKLGFQTLNEILSKINFNNQQNETENRRRKNSVPPLEKRIYERVLLKMCANNQVYNKMNEKITLNRYIEIDCEEEDKVFKQIQSFEKLIDFWDQYNQKNTINNCQLTRKYYFTIIKLYQSLPSLEKDIQSLILMKLYQDLKVSVQNMVHRLRDKLLVLFVATPLDEKCSLTHEKDKFMVNYSQILQRFQLEERQSRSEIMSLNESMRLSLDETDEDSFEGIKFFSISLKLNEENIENLGRRQGCRYLALNFHQSKNNDHEILGQEEKGNAYIFKDDYLCKKIVNIPFVNLFVCLSKPKFASKLAELTYKEIVYFDFRKIEREEAEKSIMMTTIMRKIIQNTEKGKEFHSAYIQAKSQICFKDEKGKISNRQLQQTMMIKSYELGENQYCKFQKPNIRPQPIEKELIIKNENLKAIEKLVPKLKLTLKDRKSSEKIICDEKTIFNNLVYFMREKMGYTEIFQVSNQSSSPFTEFYNDIVKVYYSKKKLMIIFKNYSISKVNVAWINKQIQRLFLQEQFVFSLGVTEIRREVRKNIFTLNSNKDTEYFICAIKTVS